MDPIIACMPAKITGDCRSFHDGIGGEKLVASSK